ncbi:MAG: alpha/beta hydrolase [Cupriavidus sp.]|nr:alpha/beta hydrolase [Cupriavidus sp.]
MLRPAMPVFVGVHGAWSGGWAWWRMHSLFLGKGIRFVMPTCTGLGERAHLLNPGIDLNTHIEDIVQVIEHEDLSDVVLVGHSYGGMVATGVAARVANRIRRLIYVDALLPEPGECALDLLPRVQSRGVLEAAQQKGFGWLIPPTPMPEDTPARDLDLAATRRGPQPLRTFTSALRARAHASRLPATYVYCTRIGLYDSFGSSAARARGHSGWTFHELNATHNPHITMPERLVELLTQDIERSPSS